MKVYLGLVAILIGAYAVFMRRDKFDPAVLKGKRILVTGASSGIGEQIAYHYARAGASVVITARRQHLLEKVIEKCKAVGSPEAKFDYIALEMGIPAHARQVIETAAEKLGGLDHLILNHAFLDEWKFWSGTEQNFTLLDYTFDVNFKSYVHLASYAMPHLKQSKGSIAVISSMAGKMSTPFMITYASTKFALDGFFSGLRQELKLQNIEVSVTMCVLGLIDTEHAQKTPEKVRELVAPASVPDTAMDIIEATSRRDREMMTPSSPFLQLHLLLNSVVPEFVERQTRDAFSEKVPPTDSS